MKYESNWMGPPKKALQGKQAMICFKKLNDMAVLPEYKTSGASGMDLCASDAAELPPGQVTIVSTGLAMSMPKGYEAQIRPRSGLAAKFGITVLNSPGTIDSDYRGEIKVIMINHSEKEFDVAPGDRIAQMVIAHTLQPMVREVDILDTTERGEGGLGSTGIQ